MNETDRPIANPVVALREEFDDWAVLYNPDTADALGTNPVGLAAWKLMDGKRSVGEIVSEIKDRFTDTPDEAGRQIAAFVDTLSAKGFIGLELADK